VTKPELQQMAQRGVSEVDSKGGFTGPAVDLAKQRSIKLFSRNKRVR
jgi:hypothetical protein